MDDEEQIEEGSGDVTPEDTELEEAEAEEAAEEAASPKSPGVQKSTNYKQTKLKQLKKTKQLAQKATKAAIKTGAKTGAKAAIKAGAAAVTAEAGGAGELAVEVADKAISMAKKFYRVARRIEETGKVISETVEEGKKWAKYAGYIAAVFAAILIFSVMLLSSTQQAAQANPAEATTQITKTGPAAIGNDATEIDYSIQVSDRDGVSDISVVDTIPSNATFVKANGVPHVNTAANTVTWSTKESFPASPNNATFTITLKPITPNSYVINKASASSIGATIGGLSFPSNFDPKTCFDAPPQNSGGLPGKFCEMPPAPDGSYELIGTRWGSQEMIGVLYTVAKRWKSVYPEGNLIIGDITAAGGHISHFYGVAADITATTNKHDCVADMVPGGDGRCRYGSFNAEATTELAKMFIDTGYADLFLFKSDVEYTHYPNPDIPKGIKTTFTKEIYNYGRNKFPNRITYPNRIIQNRNDHNNHFHLYVDRDNKNYPNAGTFNSTFTNSQLIRCGQTAGHKLC